MDACIISTFKNSVLTAVNLGGDTDTIGAITGGLAGLEYGESEIPEEWKKDLVKPEEIENLGSMLQYDRGCQKKKLLMCSLIEPYCSVVTVQLLARYRKLLCGIRTRN